jgi:alpha-aminoadipate carrier protein LysW
MAICPACDAEIDEVEDAEKGEIVSCPDCGVDLEVVDINPVELEVVSDIDEDDEEDYDEDEDEDEDEEEDDDLDDYDGDGYDDDDDDMDDDDDEEKRWK